jgi:hypothetical protein
LFPLMFRNFNVMQSHLSSLALISQTVGVLFRKSLPVPVPSDVFL